MKTSELTLIVVVAIIAFAGVFYLATQSNRPSGETLIENSLLVKSGDPAGEIRQRLGAERLYIEQHLYSTNDSRNSMVAIMSAEIARALALQRKNVTVYALVDGGENICGTTNCTGAKVVVQSGGCNCVRFEGDRIFVEGSGTFLSDQAVRAGRLFGFALYKR